MFLYMGIVYIKTMELHYFTSLVHIEDLDYMF